MSSQFLRLAGKRSSDFHIRGWGVQAQIRSSFKVLCGPSQRAWRNSGPPVRLVLGSSCRLSPHLSPIAEGKRSSDVHKEASEFQAQIGSVSKVLCGPSQRAWRNSRPPVRLALGSSCRLSPHLAPIAVGERAVRWGDVRSARVLVQACLLCELVFVWVLVPVL